MYFRTAQDTFTPTTLPPNVVPLKTSAQANQEAAGAFLINATNEELDDLIGRLRALYLTQLDRADETLRSLGRANDEFERRARRG